MKNTVQGFALIAAIFLLVVLGLLGFYLLSLSGTQTFTGLWAVQGSRALYAARSGVQWGAFDVTHGGTCAAPPTTVDAGGPTPFNLAISCTPSPPNNELGVNTTVWQIRATASTGALGDPGFVQRTVMTTVSDP